MDRRRARSWKNHLIGPTTATCRIAIVIEGFHDACRRPDDRDRNVGIDSLQVVPHAK